MLNYVRLCVWKYRILTKKHSRIPFMQNFDAILSFKNISFSKISCTLHDPIINVNWVSLQRRYRQTFEQQEMKYFVILKEVWTNTFKMQKF